MGQAAPLMGSPNDLIRTEQERPRRILGSRVQDVDRPAHIQPLPEPAGARRARVDAKTLRLVTSVERLDGIPRHPSSQRRLGQRPAVGPLEPERPVGPARNPVALLVHRAVMPASIARFESVVGPPWAQWWR